jgi:branched-chain amino acid transport system permease protein
MGFRALLMGVVAAIVGGVGSVPGAIIGGIFIGLVQHFGIWVLPTQWQDAIVFAILILFLLVRPQGVLGTPLKKAGV